MSLVINTNSSALNTIQSLEKSKAGLTSSMQKLSSGLKINGAADNSADLAIATRMGAQIGSLIQASANAQAGVSLINIADGALNSIAESITSLRSLAIQAANGTLTSTDRHSINKNAEALLQQINSVVSQTNFNGLNLLDGTLQTTLQVGTEAGDTIAIAIDSANTAETGAVIVTSTNVTNALTAGDLVINAVTIGASVSDGLSHLDSSASAIAIANAINASGTDINVTATANPTVTEVTSYAPSSALSGTITINGIAAPQIALGSASQQERIAIAIDSINSISNQTGVVASADLTTGNLVMTAEDGRNITVEYTGMVNTDLGAVAAGTTMSSVTLTSDSAIAISGNNPEYAGLTAGVNSTLTPLSSADLSSQANAINSLAVIDGAINTISNLRAGLGAIENRLYSAIDNLGNSSVNLQDAKSQIMDTDFAVEMSNFAKLQILQQAGISMLSQANQQPQGILKLLG